MGTSRRASVAWLAGTIGLAVIAGTVSCQLGTIHGGEDPVDAGDGPEDAGSDGTGGEDAGPGSEDAGPEDAGSNDGGEVDAGSAPEDGGDAGGGAGRLVLTLFPLTRSFTSSADFAHGLAMVIRTPSGRTYVYDTGKNDGTYDVIQHSLKPFLQDAGISVIDGLVVSHAHTDHVNGVRGLLGAFKVREIIDVELDDAGVAANVSSGEASTLASYRSLRRAFVADGGLHRPVQQGDRLEWDSALEVEVLSPPPSRICCHAYFNNNSVVLRIRHGATTFLLPGDIEYSGMRFLWDHYVQDAGAPESLDSDVLVAPHHGIHSYYRFAQAVSPSVVLVSSRPCLYTPSSGTRIITGCAAREAYDGGAIYASYSHGRVEVASDGGALAVTPQSLPELMGDACPSTPVPSSGCYY